MLDVGWIFKSAVVIGAGLSSIVAKIRLVYGDLVMGSKC